jgi:arabinogalactan endo-1,4-beta-galactosidase
MCGASDASDCGPDNNASQCAVSFVDQQYRCSNWPHFVALLNATISAVRDAGAEQTKVMVHVSDWGKAVWWLQMATGLGLAPFDLLGVSYYPQWHSYTSGGPLNTLRCNCSWCLANVEALYPELSIVLVETMFPFEPYNNTWNWTEPNADFPFTPEGQHEYLQSLLHLAQGTFGTKGRSTGVYWWCTECADSYWLNFSNSYYHSALFDHDGVANPAQQAWSSSAAAKMQPPCALALETSCPWVGGRCENCSTCVASAFEAGKLDECQEGARAQWCMAAFGGQLKAFHCT